MTVDDDAPSSVPVDLVVAVDIHRNAATVGNVDARDATRNPAAAAGAPAIVHGWTRHVASSRTSNASTAARERGDVRERRRRARDGFGAEMGGNHRHRRRLSGDVRRARGGYESPRASSFAQVLTRRVHRDANRPDARERAEVRRRETGVASETPVVAAVTATPPSAIVAEGFTPVAAGGSATVTAIPPESVDSPSPNPSASATATIRVGVRGIVAGVSHRRIADETKTPGAGSAAAEPPRAIVVCPSAQHEFAGRGVAGASREHIAAGEGDGVAARPQTRAEGGSNLAGGEKWTTASSAWKNRASTPPLPLTPTPRKP